MIKSKKQMFLVIGIFALMLFVGGVTYAFFNYTRTGAGNTIRVGRIAFISRQTETINLSNLFPIDPTETGIMDDEEKVGTLEIEIEGDTDYVDGVEYLISTVNSSITTNGKTLPISLDVTVTNLGTSNDDYFTARESKNATIYKKLIGDTLTGDEQVLVGYIKPNTTSGTKEGVNGKITIKAYLDKNKILISDTYNNGEESTDNMGTSVSMGEGKTVFTTTEWNALQQNGVSFQIKVEANEGIWVEEVRTLYGIMQASTIGVDIENGVDFSKTSDEDNTKGVYTFNGTESDTYPVYYYRGAVDNNNVVFANKCWKAVRTTDTGGVKLIYNGENAGTNNEPNCNNTGGDTQISLSGTTTFAFNTSSNSPAYNGYMYGTVYTYSSSNWTSNAKFGSSFTWDGTNYKLVDASVTTPNATHHYSCNSTDAEATCTDLRYVYYVSGSTKYYVTLTGGDGIEQAITKMQTNTTDSNAKDKIDTWYASNLTSYTSKLEDTVWCNDRSVGDNNNNGWIANGGNLTTRLNYGAKERSAYAENTSTVKNQPSLVCANKNDAFTVSNGNGNQALTYPVALLTEDEMVLAGGVGGVTNGSFYLTSGAYWWSLSPYRWGSNDARGFDLYGSGGLYSDDVVLNTRGLRPSVSLKPGTPVVRGSGTVDDPYIIS